MGELIRDPLQARTQLPLSKAACLQLELPVPDSGLGPTPSLQGLFQSCDPAPVNLSVEEPGVCCELDSELLWPCCCHRRKIRGREKAEGINGESVIWTRLSSMFSVTGRNLSGLHGRCSSIAVLWAIIWHLQQYCLCILPWHRSHRHQATSDTKPLISVLQHVKEVLPLNAFLRDPFSSFLHVTVTSWNKVMPLAPTGHFISGAAFASPPIHTPSLQPHPALAAAE